MKIKISLAHTNVLQSVRMYLTGIRNTIVGIKELPNYSDEKANHSCVARVAQYLQKNNPPRTAHLMMFSLMSRDNPQRFETPGVVSHVLLIEDSGRMLVDTFAKAGGYIDNTGNHIQYVCPDPEGDVLHSLIYSSTLSRFWDENITPLHLDLHKKA